jgi:hypothetical protein
VGVIVFLFWYCFDDTLAHLFNNPWMGNVPVAVWLVIIALVFVGDMLWGVLVGLYEWVRWRLSR